MCKFWTGIYLLVIGLLHSYSGSLSAEGITIFFAVGGALAATGADEIHKKRQDKDTNAKK